MGFLGTVVPGKLWNWGSLRGIWVGRAGINEFTDWCCGDLPEIVGIRVDQTSFVRKSLIWSFWSSEKYFL